MLKMVNLLAALALAGCNAASNEPAVQPVANVALQAVQPGAIVALNAQQKAEIAATVRG